MVGKLEVKKILPPHFCKVIFQIIFIVIYQRCLLFFSFVLTKVPLLLAFYFWRQVDFCLTWFFFKFGETGDSTINWMKDNGYNGGGRFGKF